MIFIKKLLPNLLVLSSIMMMFIFAQATNNQDIQNIFRLIDDLATNLILVIIAITFGLFVKQYIYVLAGLVGAMALVFFIPAINNLLNLSPEYVLACGLVCLGFSAVSNIYANYRNFN
ncbi:hypothetical protein [Polynucleobacter sp. 30F-ANTBAC]|uniref:hypothetical protein n=1 Tax=Polynucleobacter sp. 30F-ANTBAC TaxID=2689095 RepID=UPI001C0B1349|nr:hypothetical protein [Polynucleobacter sp. 30F-ANTBAC]